MSVIIHEKTPGGLYPSSARTVNTYESSLCRVDRVFTCATASAETHRATLAVGGSMPDGVTEPAIDGLFIFPAPQEIRRQDGFTDFVVSAYGRTSSAVQNVVLTQSRIRIPQGSCGVWEVSGEICIPKNELLTLDMLEIDELLFAPFDISINKYAGFRNPSYKTLSVTEMGSAGPGYKFFDTSAIIGPGTYVYKTNATITRFYKVEMTVDGSTVAATVNIGIADPTILLSASRAYGNFVEMSFRTQRYETSAEIVETT